MRNSLIGEARLGQDPRKRNEARTEGFGGLRVEKEVVEAVDFRVHFGADKDAGYDGKGAEAEI